MIAIIDYCLYEDVPKELSATYNALVQFYGQEFADTMTYEVEIDLCSSTR